MKLPSGYRIRSLAEYLTNLYLGTRYGAATGAVTVANSSAFGWRGTVLSSGSALPDTPYPMSLRALNAFVTDGRKLFAFPDRQGEILEFDGIGFPTYKKIFPIVQAGGSLVVSPGGACQHIDESILFSGEMDVIPGVYQMKNGAICQAFVPAGATPGVDSSINIGFAYKLIVRFDFMGNWTTLWADAGFRNGLDCGHVTANNLCAFFRR
jgi:hypothetical protein